MANCFLCLVHQNKWQNNINNVQNKSPNFQKALKCIPSLRQPNRLNNLMQQVENTLSWILLKILCSAIHRHLHSDLPLQSIPSCYYFFNTVKSPYISHSLFGSGFPGEDSIRKNDVVKRNHAFTHIFKRNHAFTQISVFIILE